MFVVISMLISFAILALLLYFSKQRQTTLQRKYDVLIVLREILLLCRQHRNLTHHALIAQHSASEEVDHVEALLLEKSHHLIAAAQFDNKPMYRILQLKLKSLMKEWPERSVERNQMIHGKTIRHCLFLMDEIALAWLIESEREDLSDEYHLNWQQILDTMEVLTQLRISIQDAYSAEGTQRIKYHCDKMRRKMNQLSLISPLSITSPSSSDAQLRLSEICSCETLTMPSEELYQLTTDLSLCISQVYDQMLSDLTETLYLPLPKTNLSANMP